MARFEVQPDDPAAPDVHALLDAHLAFARRHSPPEDVHALDDAGRSAVGISYFTIRENGALLGVGALKLVDATHAEIKSMHTAEPARGRGVAHAMVEHLIATARARGCTRVSLETGTMAAFEPARALYESHGFTPCPPFNGYWESPNSVCMTLPLEE